MDSKRNHHDNKGLCFPIHFMESDDHSGDGILCPCGRLNREENMIGCDSSHSNVKWYRFSCAGIDSIKNVREKTKWLCNPGRKS